MSYYFQRDLEMHIHWTLLCPKSQVYSLKLVLILNNYLTTSKKSVFYIVLDVCSLNSSLGNYISHYVTFLHQLLHRHS